MASSLFDRLNQHRPPPAKEMRNAQSEKLLEWLVVHWAKPTVSLRDICRSAPTVLRNKRTILNLTQELEERGWLTPTPAHRHDRRIWKIARGLPLDNHA